MPQELEHIYMDELLSRGSQSTLERRFIMEYLQNNGYQFEDLKKMPLSESRQIMTKACRYASLKMAEVESRAKFRDEIRGPSSA
jgi:hypothetical protein